MSQAGSLNTSGGGGPGTPIMTLTGNSGGAVSPSGNNVFVKGDGTTINVVGNPGTNTLTISTVATGDVASITATAPLTANAVSGAPQTGAVTVALTTPVALTYGGTNASLTASDGGIFYSTASAGAILAGTATASKMLLSGASTTPSWSTSTIPTSAGATANKILLSDGTNYVLSTPTFPNASATTGKIIISDGTNWIASTPTYPAAAGTLGNILTSDGTNWTSVAPATSGTVTTVSVASANGFAGTVANASSTPAITIETTQTGVLSGNGTAISGSAVTQFDVLVGGASNAISSIGPGSAGQVLQSGGNAANPAYSTATYPSTAGTIGNVLTSDGTNWTSSPITTAFTSINVQVFPTSVTYTPTAGMLYCIVECVGGGGRRRRNNHNHLCWRRWRKRFMRKIGLVCGYGWS